MKEFMTIQGLKIEVEHVPYEAVKPVKEIPIKQLICCCCGQHTQGRQWWNRDTGFGLCVKCAEFISKEEDEESMKSCYGEKGVHYAIAG